MARASVVGIATCLVGVVVGYVGTVVAGVDAGTDPDLSAWYAVMTLLVAAGAAAGGFLIARADRADGHVGRDVAAVAKVLAGAVIFGLVQAVAVRRGADNELVVRTVNLVAPIFGAWAGAYVAAYR